MKTPILRVLLFIATLAIVVIVPWWISMPLLVAFGIYFPLYIEIMFFGLLFDSLYSSGFRFPFPFLTASFVLLVASVMIKSRIRSRY